MAQMPHADVALKDLADQERREAVATLEGILEWCDSVFSPYGEGGTKRELEAYATYEKWDAKMRRSLRKASELAQAQPSLAMGLDLDSLADAPIGTVLVEVRSAVSVLNSHAERKRAARRLVGPDLACAVIGPGTLEDGVLRLGRHFAKFGYRQDFVARLNLLRSLAESTMWALREGLEQVAMYGRVITLAHELHFETQSPKLAHSTAVRSARQAATKANQLRAKARDSRVEDALKKVLKDPTVPEHKKRFRKTLAGDRRVLSAGRGLSGDSLRKKVGALLPAILADLEKS